MSGGNKLPITLKHSDSVHGVMKQDSELVDRVLEHSVDFDTLFGNSIETNVATDQPRLLDSENTIAPVNPALIGVDKTKKKRKLSGPPLTQGKITLARIRSRLGTE